MGRNRDDDDSFDDFFDVLDQLLNNLEGINVSFDTDHGDKGLHTDIHEYDDKITVIADLPGVDKEDIDLQCTGQTLSIHAVGGTRSYDERIDLPAQVDKHSANATYNNEVLEVSFDRVDDSPNIGRQ